MNQSPDRAVVGVFGSARLSPPDPRYAEAFEVGRRLAEAGFAIMTGGYDGLMAAVSQGSAEAGGHVIGLPMRRWSRLEPNRWVAEARWADDIFQRLAGFHTCDALLGLPGGSGTLSEAALAWAGLQTDPEITPPLLLLGPAWAELWDHFRRLLVVDDRDLSLVRLVPSAADVVPALQQALEQARGEARRFGEVKGNA